jgi:uncharacterized RDD family membrane protein YckC
VVETALAPAFSEHPAQRPGLMLAHSRETMVEPGESGAAPRQAPLFAYRPPRKVVGLDDYMERPVQVRRKNPGGTRRRRMVSEAQAAFQFDQPQAGATRRWAQWRVAPLPVRAMAACFDAFVVLGLTSAFLFIVKTFLGELPLDRVCLACYAGSALALAGLYKLLWGVFGQVTLGLQVAHIELVRFDGARPTTGQRMWRVMLGGLSLASAGMGVVWSLADEDRLTWHDHISQTYLARRQDVDDDGRN